MGGIGERKGERVGFPVNILMITMPIKRVTTAGRRRGQRMREHGEELWEKHEEQICSFCSLSNTKNKQNKFFYSLKRRILITLGHQKQKSFSLPNKFSLIFIFKNIKHFLKTLTKRNLCFYLFEFWIYLF